MSMTTHRLTGLILLTVHRDIPLDISTAVDELSRRQPCRLQMLDILKRLNQDSICSFVCSVKDTQDQNL